jgi:hypothetical protein
MRDDAQHIRAGLQAFDNHDTDIVCVVVHKKLGNGHATSRSVFRGAAIIAVPGS